MKRSISMVLLVLMSLSLILTSCGGNKSMDNFIEQSQSQIDSMASSVDGIMKIELTAKDKSTAVLTYTILDESIEIDKATLDQNLVASESVFKTFISTMETAGVKSPKLTIKYIGFDGSEITSKDFS